MVGFGPEGVSRHPDHKVMCEVALAAFDRAADPAWYPGHFLDGGRPWAPFKLYQFELPEEVLAGWGVPLAGVPRARLTTVIDTSQEVETKIRAFHCHRTQQKDVERILGRPGYREFAGRETYVLARTRLAGLRFPEDDLLAGIPDE
jgi:LmbE family N-acetylglucosaminyl deacetylase